MRRKKTEEPCPLCGKKLDIGIIEICQKCFMEMTMKYDIFANALDNGIRTNYNIRDVDQIPLTDCSCHNGKTIPFDYYTKEKRNGTVVVLNAICTNCGGYKEIDTDQNSEINFKPVNHCGRFETREEVKKREDHEMFI